MKHVRSLVWASAALLAFSLAPAQAADREPGIAQREPYGIGLEGFPYPYPVNLLPLVKIGRAHV